jgi:hypothetical protein
MMKENRPKESARHSLAARGMKTKARRSNHSVPTGQPDQLKHQAMAEDLEVLVLVEMGKVFADARAETCREEEIIALLVDESWVKNNLRERAVPEELHELVVKSLDIMTRKYREDEWMPDERSDKARAISESFVKDLNSLDSVDSYRQFVLKYFHDQVAKETMLNLVGLGDLASRRLNGWVAFRKFFVYRSYQQFAKQTASFVDEDTRSCFMSR